MQSTLLYVDNSGIRVIEKISPRQAGIGTYHTNTNTYTGQDSSTDPRSGYTANNFRINAGIVSIESFCMQSEQTQITPAQLQNQWDWARYVFFYDAVNHAKITGVILCNPDALL